MSSTSKESPKVNILMVDDSPDKLLAMESVLADLGQHLVKANSGEQALRLLLKGEFAVILLDVNMPGMDGFETASLIRQRQSLQNIPIIFVTAMSTTDAEIFKGYAFGAVDYILTPITPEILRTKVGVFVELWRRQYELKAKAEDLKALNESLAQRAEQLSQANKELESFCYTIAHDLRAPLRAMEGLTTLLLEDCATAIPPSARDCGDRIRNAAIRMDRMIQELLDYSRITLMPVQLAPVKVSRAIKEAVAQLNGELERTGAQVKVRRASDLVQAHHPILVQALANLVANAIKFVDSERPPVVNIWTEPHGENVRIWVQDNGIGIALAHQSRIFRVFERLHDNQSYPGTGIGLAIVEKALHRMHGKAGVESEPGKGSRFWIELAAVPAA